MSDVYKRQLHIQVRLGMDDAFRLVREAAGITPQDALDLRRCQRKTQDCLLYTSMLP